MFLKLTSSAIILFNNVFVMNTTVFCANLTRSVNKRVIGLFNAKRVGLVINVVIVTTIVSTFLSGANAATYLVPIIVNVYGRTRVPISHRVVPLTFTTNLNNAYALVNAPPGVVTGITLGTTNVKSLRFNFFRCT